VCRVSTLQDENLEVDSGNGCSTMWMYLTTLNHRLKVDKIINFCYIYSTKIKISNLHVCVEVKLKHTLVFINYCILRIENNGR
jgi:hypothetical protein